MATAWPTTVDVQNLLRVTAGDTGDDTLVGQDLAAAIAWVTNRADPIWTTPGNPGYLPDPLFTAAQYQAARLYRRRDSVDGTIGWGDMGIVRVGPKDPDIETLLAAYLRIVFA
jgi:hypothetical protein